MLSVVLVSFALVGCSQHQGMPISEETAASDQHLPFDAASDKGGIFPTGSLTPNAIPAGTPLSVRLRTSLSSATCQPGDSFEAVLDEPVIVRGKMLAPRGAAVTGKVLDAKSVGRTAGAGLHASGPDFSFAQWPIAANPDLQHLCEARLASRSRFHHAGQIADRRSAGGHRTHQQSPHQEPERPRVPHRRLNNWWNKGCRRVDAGGLDDKHAERYCVRDGVRSCRGEYAESGRQRLRREAADFSTGTASSPDTVTVIPSEAEGPCVPWPINRRPSIEKLMVALHISAHHFADAKIGPWREHTSRSGGPTPTTKCS